VRGCQKLRGSPGNGQVHTQLHVFGKMPCGQARAGCQLPGQGHAGTHEVAGTTQAKAAQRAHLVFHQPGKRQHACAQARALGGHHQVQHLHRALCLHAALGDGLYPSGADLAVGIHHHHHVRRRVTQGIHTKSQGMAFSAQAGVLALQHLGTTGACHAGGVVLAVVGNHQQAVVRSELALQAVQGGQEVERFVMGWHQNGHAQRRVANAGHGRQPRPFACSQGQQQQNPGRNGQQQGQCAAKDAGKRGEGVAEEFHGFAL
jgi:hypothetical protein